MVYPHEIYSQVEGTVADQKSNLNIKLQLREMLCRENSVHILCNFT